MIHSRHKQLLFVSRQRKLNPYTQGSQEGGNGLVVFHSCAALFMQLYKQLWVNNLSISLFQNYTVIVPVHLMLPPCAPYKVCQTLASTGDPGLLV